VFGLCGAAVAIAFRSIAVGAGSLLAR
jgi:hypothetical protein